MDQFRSRSPVHARRTARSFCRPLLGIAVFLLFGWLGKLVVGKWYEPPAQRLADRPLAAHSSRTRHNQGGCP